MIKLTFKLGIAAMACLSMAVLAAEQDKPTDPYNTCVDATIQALKLGNINNAVVESCSNRTKALYAKQIV